MDQIIAIAITLGIAAVIGIAAFLLWRIYKRMLAKNALASKRDRGYIRRILLSAYPEKYVLRDLRLPRKLYPEGADNKIDIALLTRGGITLIKELHLGGAIDNAYTGNWGIKGVDGTEPFDNPFEAGALHVAAVRELLSSHGIYNTAINVNAVFTDSGVVLRFKNEKILFPETLLPYIHDLNQNRFLRGAERSRTAELLSKYTASNLKKRRDARNAAGIQPDGKSGN